MERRRRDAAAREENVGEGDWDYEEQDGDIIEDAGEDTVTNLKSGYEPTAEEIERAQSAKYSKDKVRFVILHILARLTECRRRAEHQGAAQGGARDAAKRLV